MAYNQAQILFDKYGNPIPVYYNNTTGNYEALTGANGAGYSTPIDSTGNPKENQEGTALISQARTATAVSNNISNPNCSGIMVYLNVTAASGTGGLTIRIQGIDPVSGGYTILSAAPTAITATGLYTYELHPGSGTAAGGATTTNSLNQRTQGVLPKTFNIRVNHGDATSYTYSVGYSLIN